MCYCNVHHVNWLAITGYCTVKTKGISYESKFNRTQANFLTDIIFVNLYTVYIVVKRLAQKYMSHTVYRVVTL